MARIALKDQVDLISIMVPFEVIAKNYKQYICMCFCINHKHGKTSVQLYQTSNKEHVTEQLKGFSCDLPEWSTCQSSNAGY